jgi:hypothetical protein
MSSRLPRKSGKLSMRCLADLHRAHTLEGELLLRIPSIEPRKGLLHYSRKKGLQREYPRLIGLEKLADESSDYIFFTSYVQPTPQVGVGLWANTSNLETANGTPSSSTHLNTTSQPLQLPLSPNHLPHNPHPIPLPPAENTTPCISAQQPCQ